MPRPLLPQLLPLHHSQLLPLPWPPFHLHRQLGNEVFGEQRVGQLEFKSEDYFISEFIRSGEASRRQSQKTADTVRAKISSAGEAKESLRTSCPSSERDPIHYPSLGSDRYTAFAPRLQPGRGRGSWYFPDHSPFSPLRQGWNNGGQKSGSRRGDHSLRLSKAGERWRLEEWATVERTQTGSPPPRPHE